MKKILSLILALALCASFTLALASCTEEEAKEIFENLTKEEWQQALAAPNFENVTINYEYTNEGILTKQIAKFTKDGVYRKMESFGTDGKSNGDSMALYFEGEEATQQRNLFLQTFLAIVEDRDNFEYNETTKLYTAKSAEARIEQSEAIYITEKMKDGKLAFNKEGNVDTFECNLSETIYMNNEVMQSVTIDVTWTFSNYGTTTITAAEKESKAN